MTFNKKYDAFVEKLKDVDKKEIQGILLPKLQYTVKDFVNKIDFILMDTNSDEVVYDCFMDSVEGLNDQVKYIAGLIMLLLQNKEELGETVVVDKDGNKTNMVLATFERVITGIKEHFDLTDL